MVEQGFGFVGPHADTSVDPNLDSTFSVLHGSHCNCWVTPKQSEILVCQAAIPLAMAKTLRLHSRSKATKSMSLACINLKPNEEDSAASSW